MNAPPKPPSTRSPSALAPRSIRGAARWALGAAAAALATSAATPARALIVERVLAVVDQQAIFQSDLRQRERPLVAQIVQHVPPGYQRDRYVDEMRKRLLDAMIDEKVEQIAADRAKLSVSSDEIDRALQTVASRENVSVDQLLSEAAGAGMTVQELRDQWRRQLLEEKLMSLRVNQRIRISPEDVRVGYFKLQREERRHLGYRAQWVVLQVPADSSPAAREERRKLADSVVASARAGADFAQLAAQYSDDVTTRKNGGDLGPAKPGDLTAQLEEVAFSLDVGEVSNPFVYSNQIVILRMSERDASNLPPLAKAQQEVANRLYGERIEKAKRQWLDELKRSIYVHIN